MGEVHLARSPGGRDVVVKLMRDFLSEDPAARERFRREVAMARSVAGAFIAPIVDADMAAEVPWLATAFVPGLSLMEAVGRFGPLPVEAVFALAAGLAEALVAIHRAGVVHRDLKPSNIMLAPDGPRVIDFGIAHAVAGTRVTSAGQVVGTPGFMSPEQAAGGAAGPEGDVYCLGAVLYYAAVGHGPFGEARPEVLVFRNARQDPDLGAIGDPGLRTLIGDCMAADPGDRPRPQDLAARLASAGPAGTGWLPNPLATEVGSRAASATTEPRRRRWPRMRLVVPVACLLVAGAIATVQQVVAHQRHCDAACRLADSETAFYTQWTPKIRAVDQCSGSGQCVPAVVDLDGIRAAIRSRPDAARYTQALNQLTALDRTAGGYDTCAAPVQTALPVPSCDGLDAKVHGAAELLATDLSAVVDHTLEGQQGP
jgi:hypothetical protein